MASKHLRELLNEDQEPFILKNYIDERRCQIKRSVPKTHLQIKKRKPISESSSFSSKNACFFSFNNSPDVKKSPLFDFSSPAKRSPCRNSNTFFLNIPSRTATLLLEAAMRIQKQSVSQKPKNPKNLGFGLFGSFLKRIAHRKREIKGDERRVSVKDILRWDSSNGRQIYTEKREEIPETMVDLEEKRVSEMGFPSSSTSRFSSVWSESNEEKSLDLETSSSRSEYSEDMELVLQQRRNGDFSSSPCRLVLPKSSSPSHPLLEFESPSTSQVRQKKQVIDNEEGSLNRAGKEFEEEEKEQNSPVSVLDPPFEDDDDDEGREDRFDLEHGFAVVQRTKQQLLQKLRRFERLAGLDPVELEKRITEEDEQEEEYHNDEDEDEDEDDSVFSDGGKCDDVFIREVLCRSSSNDLFYTIPSHMKRLVMDLVAEEEDGEETEEPGAREVIMKNVCKRLESWKEVESNTIDMMVEVDIKREADEWKKNRKQVQEIAVAIELAVFDFLVEEFSEQLTCPF